MTLPNRTHATNNPNQEEEILMASIQEDAPLMQAARKAFADRSERDLWRLEQNADWTIIGIDKCYLPIVHKATNWEECSAAYKEIHAEQVAVRDAIRKMRKELEAR